MTTSARQRGATMVEFALLLLLFLTFMLSLLEYSRMMFLWNAVQEVSRRAARGAAVTDFSDNDAMQALRQDALLGNGGLPLASEIGAANLRIDYLWMNADGDLALLPALPACPLANRSNCLRQPYGDSCIRFVRVRLCGAGAGDGDDEGCAPLDFQPLLPWGLVPTKLPKATSMTPAESLGYVPGQAQCP